MSNNSFPKITNLYIIPIMSPLFVIIIIIFSLIIKIKQDNVSSHLRPPKTLILKLINFGLGF